MAFIPDVGQLISLPDGHFSPLCSHFQPACRHVVRALAARRHPLPYQPAAHLAPPPPPATRWRTRTWRPSAASPKFAAASRSPDGFSFLADAQVAVRSAPDLRVNHRVPSARSFFLHPAKAPGASPRGGGGLSTRRCIRRVGHRFGSFVWRLLGTHHIRNATRSLRIVLLGSEERVACQPNCRCDRPWNWRTQPVYLPNLEKLEMEGFEGEDQEFDFLKLVFRRSRKLTRVTVRLPDQVTPNDDWCTKLRNIFMAYPSVDANADFIPDS